MLHLNFGFGAQFVSQVNKDWFNGNTLGADSLFSFLPLGGFREEHKNMASKCTVVFEYFPFFQMFATQESNELCILCRF